MSYNTMAMKILNGQELTDFIKVRQLHEARALAAALGHRPHLAIIRTNPAPVVDAYMRLKKHYGQDIEVDVSVHDIPQTIAMERIVALNQDASVHGIIVQIPLPNPTQTDNILNSVAPHKDVDGLAAQSLYDPATPVAINWLLAGYNIELRGKQLVIVGKGRLVGSPLFRMWQNSGLHALTVDKSTPDISTILQQADVIVSATGRPHLITNGMVKPNAVIVDAGVATDSNGLVGDVAPEVRERQDITITPIKGGVGPLTVSALFDNVLRAARSTLVQ